MKTVVIVPVYNESRTVVSVLREIHALGDVVDEIVIVEDGSTDDSAQIIAEWSGVREGVTVLRHPANRGYSEALLTGFRYALDRVDSGELSPGDAVATIDADGQHDPRELPGFLTTMEEEGLDVVWARRDFSLYSRFKRLGNCLMSAMGSFFAGVPFKDVESGYCVFRLGPLRDALRFQNRDSRYSLSLTLAVALARLGYKISNEPMASIKLFRSRTRLIDGLWDTLAAANTWAKVTRTQLRSSPATALRLALGISVFVGFLAVMVLIAMKSVYLGRDSINNYAHVWYISENLFNGSLPMHFVNLDSGTALTYPYGFVPWTLAALFYPILGDRAVTLIMLLGLVLVMIVVYRTRLNSNTWLFTMFAVLPLTLHALLTFQMSFVWAMLFGYLYVWTLEKRSFVWAYVWLVLSVGDHLLIMGPILAGYTAFIYWRNTDMRRSLLWLCLLALVPLVPVAWYTAGSPTVGDNDAAFIFQIWLATIFPRSILFFFPFLLARVASFRTSWARHSVGPLVASCSLAICLGWNFLYAGYGGLVSEAQNDYEQFLEGETFVPGAVYRVVETPQHEQGQYFFIQQGAVLSNEFFAESYFRRDWTEASYRCYLSVKNVEFVVVSADYLRRCHKNEGELLQRLRSQGLAQLVYEDSQGRFMVYDVTGARYVSAKGNVKDCIRLEGDSEP